MKGGILHSAAAMDLLGRIQDVRAQNLANANTTGYRKRVASAEAFASALRSAAGLTLPSLKEDVDFTPGSLKHTGNPLDLAVDGKGFFAVETGRGVRFTRNGNFALDADGLVVAADGSRVAGRNGPIQADPNRGPLTIDQTGAVRQDGEELGQLRIVEFGNERGLVPEDNGRFREGPGTQPAESVDSKVRQGYLEDANVNVVDELVQMITGLRAFESAQRALTGIDRVRGESINNAR